MEESIQPLLNNNEQSNLRSQKKKKRSSSKTLKVKKLSFDLTKLNPKDSKAKKIENKFIFKVYLHFFVHIIFILLMILLSFKNIIFNSILSKNKFIFYIFSILAFILFILPLFTEQMLKLSPYNYLYLLFFTICISYIICKISLFFSPTIIRVFSILLIFELIYLIIDAYINKNYDIDIANTSTFMGVFLLFITAIVYFVDKISFFKLNLIFLIILLFGIYLIYDMNLIFLEKRKKFEENDYILATLYLYIDVFQTIFELIGKFYNSCEPERKPIQKLKEAKSMIYTGDEAYEDLYNEKNEEKKLDMKNKIKRMNSAKILSLDSHKIDGSEIEDSAKEDDDYELSFKQHIEDDEKLKLENKD